MTGILCQNKVFKKLKKHVCEEQNSTWSWPSFELETVYNWICFTIQYEFRWVRENGNMYSTNYRYPNILRFEIWIILSFISLYRALCLEEIIYLRSKNDHDYPALFENCGQPKLQHSSAKFLLLKKFICL